MISHIINEYNDTPSIFYYIPNFMTDLEQKELLTYLEETKDFRQSPAYNTNITRLQKWYNKDEKYFCPLWKERYPQWESFKIDDTISNIIDKVNNYIINIPNIIIPNINSCLINKYPNGKHHISPHRDSILSFGEKPTIIGLSLGETRTIFFENNKNNFSFNLESGSMLIMAGSSQKNYLHSIKKSDSRNVRYSLTLREFIL